ncbi:hypothetical protein Cabys_1056 [Caldithrix abyssi DSM 13497]|uniref:Uncharacterized protein n=1 Tax=Caldithrix abyssi DSM 13497 TaxID=880073 RepID=A0A1J1C544_CALAY|nr:hypothetical protein Cabys_1056 [Caldithrix abyssi DSM 13497]
MLNFKDKSFKRKKQIMKILKSCKSWFKIQCYPPCHCQFPPGLE